MSSINRVLLMGNLTRDPVLRNLNAGSAVGEFGIAMSEVVMSKSGIGTSNVSELRSARTRLMRSACGCGTSISSMNANSCFRISSLMPLSG